MVDVGVRWVIVIAVDPDDVVVEELRRVAEEQLVRPVHGLHLPRAGGRIGGRNQIRRPLVGCLGRVVDGLAADADQLADPVADISPLRNRSR
jgi:hypothetical protein